MSKTGKAPVQKVLLVDDDTNIRFITQISIEGLTNWQLSTAGSGAEALNQLSQIDQDLVLLDMMMPDMDGIKCFSEIQTRLGAEAPIVIFMTAKAQSHEIERYRALGAAGVITKPFDPMKLPEEINSILDRYAAENEQ